MVAIQVCVYQIKQKKREEDPLKQTKFTKKRERKKKRASLSHTTKNIKRKREKTIPGCPLPPKNSTHPSGRGVCVCE